MSHLETLNPQQLQGYSRFIDWYKNSPKKLAVLEGIGGSGKTYSISKYLLESGLSQGKVWALAPTNAAVKTLAKSLLDGGIYTQGVAKVSSSSGKEANNTRQLIVEGVTCNTIHKALGWAPRKAKWGKEEELELLTLTSEYNELQEIMDEESMEKMDFIQQKISYLRREKEAHRKNELNFGPGPYSPSPEDVAGLDLVIVDECSMVSKEVFEQICFTFENNKVLFMGDSRQLFPVNEGISLSFSSHKIAQLNKNERAENRDLVDLNNNLYEADIDEMFALCRSQSAVTSNESSVFTITRKYAASLIRQWAKTLPWDGSSWRIISYKNETVLRHAINSKKIIGEDWKNYDLVVAQNPIQYYSFGEKGTALITSQESMIQSVFDKYESRILGKDGYETISVVRAAVDLEDKLPVSRYLIKNPYDPYKGEVVYNGNYGLGDRSYLVNLVSFPSMAKYSELLKFWESVRTAFYGRGKNSVKGADTEPAQNLFALLDVEGWGDIPNTPGRKRFSTEELADSETINEMGGYSLPKHSKKDFWWLRDSIQRYYFWLKGLSDPIRLRISCTVHKAQGRTVDNVIVNLPEIYESRKWSGGKGKGEARDNAERALYTAVSRAAKKVYLIGE